jgi:hypothetical protein
MRVRTFSTNYDGVIEIITGLFAAIVDAGKKTIENVNTSPVASTFRRT